MGLVVRYTCKKAEGQYQYDYVAIGRNLHPTIGAAGVKDLKSQRNVVNDRLGRAAKRKAHRPPFLIQFAQIAFGPAE